MIILIYFLIKSLCTIDYFMFMESSPIKSIVCSQYIILINSLIAPDVKLGDQNTYHSSLIIKLCDWGKSLLRPAPLPSCWISASSSIHERGWNKLSLSNFNFSWSKIQYPTWPNNSSLRDRVAANDSGRAHDHEREKRRSHIYQESFPQARNLKKVFCSILFWPKA